MIKELPIYQIRNEIIETLQNDNKLILHAPTGSGKSTQVPQYIADFVIAREKKVIVLQPRRIATRMLAGYIAHDRNSALGDEIGYRVRLEGQWSEKTRILFCTEGILLQRLLKRDTLEDTAALIFDEFHERHIETDLCLALALELQKKLRPDLKIIVMSATLETAKLQKYLNDCTVIKTEGKTYPVQIIYAQPKPYETLWDFAAAQLDSTKNIFTNGSALIFMPGTYEIRKTIDAIQKRPSLAQFTILPLYGSLTKEEQDKAMEPGGRKIIVSTNVAETSLTIPGITLIVDSGIARIARFDPRRGINTLFTEPISKSSASQRTGRAGRTAPGICIRLWSEFTHENRPTNDTPEIHRIELSEVLLGLLASGYTSPAAFPWFETPDEQAIQRSLLILNNLEAIDSNNKLTDIGKNMVQYTMHPRFSRMLTEAKTNNCLPLACVIAAISQSNGILLPTNDEIIKNERIHHFGGSFSDLLFELKAWLWAKNRQFNAPECYSLAINTNTARQITQLALQFLQTNQQNSNTKKEKLPETISIFEELFLRKCIFTGFSDFIAVRHSLKSTACQMMHGKYSQLHRDSVVQTTHLLVATELEESKTPTGVQLFLKKVTAIEEDWIENLTSKDLHKTSDIRFDTNLQKVIKITEWSWNGLVLVRETSKANNPEENSIFLAQAIKDEKIPFPQWNEEAEHYVRRVNFAAKHCPHYEIPIIDDDAKEFIIQQTVYDCKTVKEIEKCTIWPALKGWLPHNQAAVVDLVAPETIELPQRHKKVKLRYDDKGDVILSETIQALYDCPLPVTVAEGKVSVVFELLAPSRRPVQITRDLDYFWKNSYLEIKKELKGRYPKHEWR